MTGKKSHPLEIFRSSGTFQRPDPLRKEPGMGGIHTSEVPERAERPARVVAPTQEFELRLSLIGSVVLLFVWVVLIGAAYLYGYSNGQSAQTESDAASVLAKGAAIETGDANARPDAANLPVTIPFGVKLIAYDRTPEQERILDEMRGLLQTRYGIDSAVITDWPDTKRNQWVVYVGEFANSDDPTLVRLLNKLRTIDDYPKGRDKSPFRNATIARHPDDPAKYRKD